VHRCTNNDHEIEFDTQRKVQDGSCCSALEAPAARIVEMLPVPKKYDAPLYLQPEKTSSSFTPRKRQMPLKEELAATETFERSTAQ
jgi:hypothetical protein